MEPSRSNRTQQGIPIAPAAAAGATQLRRIVGRIGWAALTLLGLFGVGVFGFFTIGGGKASWSDAVFMTLITMSTVGYGEVVPLETFGARVFAGTMGIAGLGALTFLFTTLTIFFLEKDLDYSLRRRRMEKRIKKLRHHYIVCGFGRVGRNAAQELYVTGRSLVAIDPEQARFDENLEKFPDLLYLQGDASDDEILLRANIVDAKGLFAVAGDDSRNLMIIITAKQINSNLRVVARAQETRNVGKMRKAGADEIVCPDFTGGMRMASAMIRPNVVSFLDEMLKSEKNIRIEEVIVPELFRSTRIGSLRLRSEDYLLLAVRTDDDLVFNPPAEHMVHGGNVIVAMASPAGRARIEEHLFELCS